VSFERLGAIHPVEVIREMRRGTETGSSRGRIGILLAPERTGEARMGGDGIEQSGRNGLDMQAREREVERVDEIGAESVRNVFGFDTRMRRGGEGRGGGWGTSAVAGGRRKVVRFVDWSRAKRTRRRFFWRKGRTRSSGDARRWRRVAEEAGERVQTENREGQ
jgi:hypothetical protein